MTTDLIRAAIEDKVADYLPGDLSDAHAAEVITLAADYAADDADGYAEDGVWVDDTPYEECAQRALADWVACKAEMEEMGDDDRAHAAMERRAGY